MRAISGLVLLVAAFPLAAATDRMDVSLETNQEFTEVGWTMNVTASGAFAAEMRGHIDSAGNGDGAVSASEVRSGEERFARIVETEEGEGSSLLVDGVNASSDELRSYNILYAEGPADSEEPLAIYTDFALFFTPGPGPNHVVTIERTDDEKEFDAAQVSLRIAAPRGYRITDAGAWPPSALNDQGTLLEHSTTNAKAAWRHENVDVTFSPTDNDHSSEGVPHLLLPALAVALLVTAQLHRKRR